MLNTIKQKLNQFVQFFGFDIEQGWKPFSKKVLGIIIIFIGFNILLMSVPTVVLGLLIIAGGFTLTHGYEDVKTWLSENFQAW